MPIRAFTLADCGPTADLTNHYITTSAIHFGTEHVAPEYFERLWTSTRARYPWLVATDDAGRYQGYAKAGVWRDRAAYDWTAEAGIYLVTEAQGQGRGTALYRALLDDLRARGFHSAIGGITLPNEPSVRLHESLGFAHVGTVRRAGWKLDRWHDVGFWQLLLHDPTHRPGP